MPATSAQAHKGIGPPQAVAREGTDGGPGIALHSAGEGARWRFEPRAAAHATFCRQPCEADPVLLQSLGEHLTHAWEHVHVLVTVHVRGGLAQQLPEAAELSF